MDQGTEIKTEDLLQTIGELHIQIRVMRQLIQQLQSKLQLVEATERGTVSDSTTPTAAGSNGTGPRGSFAGEINRSE